MPPALFVGAVLEERFLSQHIFWNQSVHICLYTQPPFWAQTSSLWVSPTELSGISVSCKIYVILFSPENCSFGFSHLDLIGKTLSALEKHISGQLFIDTPIKGADGCKFEGDEQRQYLKRLKHQIMKEPLGMRWSHSRITFIQCLQERNVTRCLPAASFVQQDAGPTHGHPGLVVFSCTVPASLVSASTSSCAGIWMCDTQTSLGSERGWLVTANAITLLPHRPHNGGDRGPRPPQLVVSWRNNSIWRAWSKDCTCTCVILAKSLILYPSPSWGCNGRL